MQASNDGDGSKLRIYPQSSDHLIPWRMVQEKPNISLLSVARTSCECASATYIERYHYNKEDKWKQY